VSLELYPVTGDENQVRVALRGLEQTPEVGPQPRKAAARRIIILHGQADCAILQQPSVRIRVLDHAFGEELAHGLAKYLGNLGESLELFA
jgi:hypothetical protein